MERIRACVQCGRGHTRKDVSYCYDCGRKRLIEAVSQMQEKKGPYYWKWRIRWEAATGLKLKGGK